jgi:hypothetical protein
LFEVQVEYGNNLQSGRAPVAHACNPSYSGGRDQEDCGSKPARANSLGDPISKIPSTKRAMEWLKVWALSSSPNTTKISGVEDLKLGRLSKHA